MRIRHTVCANREDIVVSKTLEAQDRKLPVGTGIFQSGRITTALPIGRAA